MSNLSDSAHEGAPMICLSCTPYANLIKSASVVLMVLKWLPCTRNPLPGRSGWLGLTVATSKLGLASAAMAGSLGGGVGITHSVADVARSNRSGRDPGPCVQVPAIDLPSPDILPSYLPSIP